MIIDNMNDLLTPDEVAAYLRLSVQYIYKHIRSGDIPARKLGNVWRIRKTDIINFIFKEE